MTAVGRPEIDPRIRQRRIEVRRDAGRRRLRRLLVLVGVMGLLGVGVLAALSPIFDIDDITVVGASATPVEEIVSVSGIAEGDPMVRLDVNAATAAVEELPWVDEAVIRRDYPASVEIVVTERTPVGILRSGSSEMLIDARGRVLGPVQLGFGDLPRVESDNALPAPGERVDPTTAEVLDVVEMAGKAIGDHTVVIRASAEEIELHVDQSFAIRLGSDERIEAKVRSAATVLDQVDLTCVVTIDVRIAERPVLTRDEPCQ